MKHLYLSSLCIFSVFIISACQVDHLDSFSPLPNSQTITSPVATPSNIEDNTSNIIPTSVSLVNVTPTLTRKIKPTLTSSANKDLYETLVYYPLSVGNTWVYSVTYFGYHVIEEEEARNVSAITSTFIITDEVISTEFLDSYLAAQIERTSTFVSGIKPDTFSPSPFYANPASPNAMEHTLDEGIVNPYPRTYWYVVRGNTIHYQEDLDFSNVPTSTYLYSPAFYQFPLYGKKCWFPPGIEDDCQNHSSMGVWTGFYFVKSGPETQSFPVGDLKNCYTNRRVLPK